MSFTPEAFGQASEVEVRRGDADPVAWARFGVALSQVASAGAEVRLLEPEQEPSHLTVNRQDFTDYEKCKELPRGAGGRAYNALAKEFHSRLLRGKEPDDTFPIQFYRRPLVLEGSTFSQLGELDVDSVLQWADYVDTLLDERPNTYTMLLVRRMLPNNIGSPTVQLCRSIAKWILAGKPRQGVE